MAHGLRATHDAVAVGIGTASSDDPQLTCRLPGLPVRPPVRIVFDSRLQLSLTRQLVATANDVPTWIVTLAETVEELAVERAGGAAGSGRRADPGRPDDYGRISVAQSLKALGRSG